MLILNNGVLYMQIYEYFKNEIIKGTYKANKKLPSKRNLAKEYNISLNTVDNAYSKLFEEGFIYSKERQGFFVSDVGELYVLDSKPIHITKEEENIEYDFSYSGVSEEFPYKIFKKISSNIFDNKDILEKVDYQGYLPLRTQISEYLDKSRGFKADPSQIVISSGSEYLFQIIFKLISGKFGIEDPGYNMLSNIMDTNDINYEFIPVDENGMDLTKLKKSKSDFCVITPAHQFPTGVIMNMQRRVELLNMKRIKYVIEDDYDSEFKYSKRPVPALKSIDVNDKVIYIGSFSKSISPSFRVSFMVLPFDLVEKYNKIFKFFICPVSIMVQKMLTTFIESGEFEKHLNRMRKIYSKKRQLLMDMLNERKDLTIRGADAGLHVVLEYPKTYSEEYIIKKAKEKKIKVYGLGSYGTKRETPSILLGFATLSDEKLKEGIKLFLEI
ncbi:PLP-dependent aminotransferase family protein [Parvimonas sp. D2]|uniref:MocR-like pyridoxine biosynthesis transcription factor PdxR n=1 Tax=unclassified Parvimonas TaxID=1151464 RepID=UPI002B4995A0|nr:MULTISPECIES: PLP-dependent aminotransferase family protein [unclassified Parvimonas]MEB3012754.1 PLP-dependent aminotransferase family protein [Parvimonas sp. D2]MEB3088193.1 PLP-dependent aminotransferase family protein [Parvimonas sp. D4]